MERKDYSRSIRMTNTVRNIVENFEGDGFNQKFENLVLHCMSKLDFINEEIIINEKKLVKLKSEIKEKKDISNNLQDLNNTIIVMNSKLINLINSNS